MSKDILTNKDLQINSQTKFLSNKPWKKHIIQTKTLKRKYVPKIFEEKSLPENLCREIRTENLRTVIPVQPNFEEKLLPPNIWRESFLPRNFWREITAKKYVTKFSAKESLKRHSLPKAWKEESPRKKIKTFLAKSLWQLISLPRTLWRETYTKHISAETSTEKYWNKNNLEKKHYPNKNSEEEVCTENIWREIIARKSLQRNPYRKSQNSNSCPTKFWRETSSNKYLKRKFFTKKFLKRNHCQKICDKVLCQRISKETFPAKSLERGISTKKNQNIFGKISLTISLPRTLWRETYTKHISAETSTEKYWNKKIYHKLPEGKSPQKKKSKGPPTKKKSQEKIYKTNNSREISQAMSKETFTNKAPHKNVQTKISIKSSCSKKTLKRK